MPLHQFLFAIRFIHDITVQSAIGCVFEGGRGVNLSMDHHRWAPYENLFTDLDGGRGSRLFQSSGGGMRGQHTAAGETCWNIRGKMSLPWSKGFGPDQINIVGLPVTNQPDLKPGGRWQEKCVPGQLQPADLHAAMLARRLAAGGR